MPTSFSKRYDEETIRDLFLEPTTARPQPLVAHPRLARVRIPKWTAHRSEILAGGPINSALARLGRHRLNS